MNVLKKKRNLLVTILLALTLACAAGIFGTGFLPGAGNKVHAATEGVDCAVLTYTDNGATYSVSGVDKNNGYNDTNFDRLNIVIPATYNGKPVTAIANEAFYNTNFTFTSVDFSNATNLTAIGDKAFQSCKVSGTLVLPDNLNTIGTYAFYMCTTLSGELVIPNSVTTIGEYAFFECSGLAGALTISSSVESIGKSAFAMCKGFTSLVFQENSNLTTINQNAFYNCAGLNGALIIPDSVTTIGIGAFQFCNITSLKLPENTGFNAIGENAFSYCNALSGELTIPDSVTSIGNSAFVSCKGITSLKLPKNDAFVTIGESVFSKCEKLTGELIIPDSVTTIGNNAFKDCIGITSLKLPENTEFNAIGEYAFGYCSALTGALIIPDSVTSIGQYAFAGATIQTCYLPANATFGSRCLSSALIIVAKNKTQYDSCKAAFTSDNRYALVAYETTVTFDANDGGTIDGAQQVTQTKLFGGTFSAQKNAETNIWIRNSTYKFPTATKLGHIWASYNTLKDGTGTKLQYTENVTDAPTYYAQYKENPFTYFEITNDPTKITYKAFENFDPTGMKLTANFQDGSTQEVTDYIVENGDNLQAGTSTVTVSVTIGGITLKKNIAILVNAIQLTKPTVAGTYYYNGQWQTPTFNNFDSNTMSVEVTREMAAGIWDAEISLLDTANYQWADGTTNVVRLIWTIEKMIYTVTLEYDPFDLYVGGSIPSKAFTCVTDPEDVGGIPITGTLTWSSYSLDEPATNKEFYWTFTPTQIYNFSIVTGSEKFNVLAVELESITAKLTQGSKKVYTSTDINNLKSLLSSSLVVTKHFNNGATDKTTDFTLSGDLSQAGNAVITVTAEGKTATFNVTVTAVELARITATFNQKGATIYTTATLDSLKQYLTVTGKNNDGSTYGGTIEYTLSGTLAAGTSEITVTYDGKTATFNVNVTAVELASISAAFDQNGATIYASATLDSLKQYLTVTGLNNDGSTYSGTIEYTLSGTLAAGTSQITVTFGGKTTSFSVNVTAVELASISATFNQNGAAIYVSATLDSLKQYLTVTGLNNDGLAYSGEIEYTLSGTLAAGTSEITVTFGGKTATFNVTVTAVELASISATFNQNGATIYASASLDSLKQYLTVTGLNNDGSAYGGTIEYILSGTLAAGTSEITVTFGSKTTSFSVNVTAVELASITATFNQGTDKVYNVSSLDSLKQYLTITGLNNDGSAYSGTIEYTLSGTLAAGTSQITVTVNGAPALSDTFNVAVTATMLEGLNVTSQPTKTVYTAFESFDKTGMVVTATFSHGTEIITNYTVMGGADLQAGTTSLTVTYTVDGVTKTANVSISVNRILLEKPIISGTYTYNGNAQTVTLSGFDDQTMRVTGGSATNAGNYQAVVSLADPTNYAWVDNSSDNLTLDYTIAKASYDMSGVSLTDKTVKENGSAHTLTLTGTLPSGVTVAYTGTNGYTQNGVSTAGIYEVTAAFTVTDSDNYHVPERLTATLTVNLAEITGTDNAGGTTVTITGGGNGIKPGTTVTVSEKPAEDYKDSNITFSDTKHTVLQANDITLKNNGVTVRPDGSVTVRLLIKESLRGYENLKVVYIAPDGSAQDMNATRDGDYMVFVTTHFSVYAVVAPTSVVTPVTPDNGLSGGIIALIVIASILAAVILLLLALFLLRKDKSQGFKAYFAGWLRKCGKKSADNVTSNDTHETALMDADHDESDEPDTDSDEEETDISEAEADDLK